MIPTLAVLLLLSGCALGGMGLMALRFRRSPGALPFALASLCVAVWSFTNLLDLVGGPLETRIFINRLRYVFLAPMPVFWLLMALEHTTQSSWLRPRRALPFFLVPLVTWALLAVEDRHTLLRYGFTLVQNGSFQELHLHRGPWGWIHYLYAYAVMIGASVILLRSIRGAPPLFRSQSLYLACAMLWATAFDIMFLMGLTPIHQVSFTPIALTFTNPMVAWALLRHRALDLVPIARSTVLEHLADPVVVMDLSDRIVDLNPAAARALGVPLAAAVGRSVADALSAWPPLLEFYSGGQPEAGVEMGGRYYQASRVPLEDGAGKARGFLLVLNDLTQRRQTEEDLRESERSLRLAKEAAEAASRAKGAFLANMSHEIRTPLTGVIGGLELLLAMELGQEQRDCARTSLRSAEALLTILNDILHLSKLEAGQLELESLPFDLEDLVQGVAELFAPSMQAKGLAWEVAVADDVPRYLRGDPARLRQVLTNLVGNAVKFTASGKVRLEVERVPKESGSLRLAFALSDTGLGLSQEQQVLLFQPFTQADPSHSRRFGGTGLGLAICRALCQRMGGEIQVSSELGRGSTFRFTVVLLESSPDSLVAGRSTGFPEESPGPLRARGRLLVAEDDATTRLVLARVLQGAGLAPVFASQGEEALGLLARAPFDLVLMDCQMPHLDGWEATRRLRAGAAGELNRRVPVVAITASATAEEVARCQEAGMIGFVAKPFKQAALLRTLEKWLPAEAQVDLDEVLADLAQDLGFDRPSALRVLGAWLEALPEAAREVATLQADGRHREARLVLHRLRGGAANLRLKELHSALAAWAQALGSGEGDGAVFQEGALGLAGRYASAVADASG